MANISLNKLKGSGLSAPVLSKTINNNYIKNDNDVNINQDYIEINYSDPNAETLINPNAYIEHPMQKYMKTDINPYAAGVELENFRAEAAAFGVSVAFGLLDVVENIGDALIMAGALISVGEASIFHPEDVEDIKKTASDIVSYDWTEGLYDASVDAMGIDYESSHGVAHSIGTVGGTMLGYTALSIGTSGAGAVVNAAVGGLSAMGSSSERALQSGATFEQAEITGLVAGGLGAATGVASEKIRTAASGARSIGDIAKYTAAGAGVAASEPIANSAVEYITYGKNNSDNIFDYYMNNGGFQGSIMAAGIGGASTGFKAAQGYSNNRKIIYIDSEEEAFIGDFFKKKVLGKNGTGFTTRLSKSQKQVISQVNYNVNNYGSATVNYASTKDISSTMLGEIDDLSRVTFCVTDGLGDENGILKAKYNKPKYINRISYNGNEMNEIVKKMEDIQSRIDMSLPPVKRGYQLYQILSDEVPVMYNHSLSSDHYLVSQSLRGLTPTNVVGESGMICAGYASAYKELCERIGVKCEYIRGFAKSDPLRGENAGLHAWNVIFDQGKVYPVDVTWRSTRYKGIDEWFGNSKYFSGYHVGETDDLVTIFNSTDEIRNNINTIIQSCEDRYANGLMQEYAKKYGEQKAIENAKNYGLKCIKEYIKTGNLKQITSKNDARNITQLFSRKELEEYLRIGGFL